MKMQWHLLARKKSSSINKLFNAFDIRRHFYLKQIQKIMETNFILNIIFLFIFLFLIKTIYILKLKIKNLNYIDFNHKKSTEMLMELRDSNFELKRLLNISEFRLRLVSNYNIKLLEKYNWIKHNIVDVPKKHGRFFVLHPNKFKSLFPVSEN